MASLEAAVAASAVAAVAAVSKAINASINTTKATFKGFNSPRELTGENFFFRKYAILAYLS